MLDISTDFIQADNAKALVILAHGAGADMSHRFMQQIADLLVERNCSVLRFNFPYMDKRLQDGKRRPPDRMPKLFNCYLKVLMSVDTDLPIVLAGKSMGSRVAASLAAESAVGIMALDDLVVQYTEQQVSDKLAQVKAVVALGYPFHPANKPEKLRLTPLQQCSKPVLICQGERDKLGSQAEIGSYDLADLCQFVFLMDGDHDLKPRVKSGFSHDQHLVSCADYINCFIEAKI